VGAGGQAVARSGGQQKTASVGLRRLLALECHGAAFDRPPARPPDRPTAYFPLVPPTVFAALKHRNFRLFFMGQFVSLCGTWIQTVAQGWLVLQLTDSAFAVGLVTTLGSLPILLFTLYGGVVADRVNKHRLVLTLQALMVIEALTLGILTYLHLVTVHWVMGLAVFFGCLSAFEVPTRQALISEIVAREDLMNAIALGSSAFNVARVVGPAVAGVLIATVGLAACYFANAASYLAVIASLLLMRPDRRPTPEPAPALEAMREGFGYMFGNRWPRAIVTIIATFAVFGFSFIPMMPVFARDALHLDARGYGAMVSAIGVGATAAAFFMAGLGGRVGRPQLVLRSSVLFGVVLTAAAFAPGFWWAIALFTVAGCLMALNGIAANTTLQIEAPDRLRGRVMGFYSFVVLGMVPFGSLQAGWIAEHYGVRTAIAAGGLVCLLVAAAVGWGLRRAEKAERRERPATREVVVAVDAGEAGRELT
jgi:MFS family permease